MEALSVLLTFVNKRRSLVDSPHREPVLWSFDVPFVVSLNKQLNKYLNRLWIETQWCLCDVTVMTWFNHCGHIMAGILQTSYSPSISRKISFLLWWSWQKNNVCSCNGWTLDMRQAIKWTTGDPIHRRLYASTGISVVEWLVPGNSIALKSDSNWFTLLWRHDGHDASQIICLRIVYSAVYLRHRSKKTSKLRVTGLCARNSPGTGEFPAQMASNAEHVSIWWRHHG